MDGSELTPESWTPTSWGFFMGKYTADFKLAVVQKYLEGSMGYRLVAEHFHIRNHSLIERWVGFYRRHGEGGLCPKRATYSAEFKLSVLKHMWDNSLSKGHTAAVFNIRRHATVGDWERAYRTGGVDALEPRRRGSLRMLPVPDRPEAAKAEDTRTREELLAEVEYLRTEVAYLKKLDALVRSQKQSATPRKKRK